MTHNSSIPVGAKLRLLEEHETKVRVLQDALVAGERSGEPTLFDFDAFKARKRAEHERANKGPSF